jgi:hypothetical protein
MAAGKYATGTTVPIGRTRDEIERTLTRYGATGFMFGWDPAGAAVAFLIDGRHVRFLLPMPSPEDKLFTHSPTGRARTEAQADAAFQQAVRSRWRSLALIVKSKLEAIDAGIVTLDDEFLANLVMPDNRTVGEAIRPQLERAITAGTTPALMPGR